MAKVPLIETQALSEFGDLREQAQFYDPTGMDRDYSYVPGFSEMRRAHETKKGEYFRGEAKRSDVPILPVNLRWGRAQDKAGNPDNLKTFGHGRRGYRMVTKADIGQPWFTELPGSAQIQADGTIRNGDCVLMVCDQQTAAKNELHKRMQTESRIEGARGGFAQAIEQARKDGLVARGSDPTVEVLEPTQREASLPVVPVSVKRQGAASKE